MSHDPEKYGYHDSIKEAKIARKVHKAMKQQSCSGGATYFHEDDCAGCQDYIRCAKQSDGFNYETYCTYCNWMGYWDDCNVKIIPMTYQDPEERYSLCPLCGNDTEDFDDV